jgi:hypothetical protein
MNDVTFSLISFEEHFYLHNIILTIGEQIDQCLYNSIEI